MSTPKRGKNLIEVMDTTLRDGEQTEGVAITAHEKLTIARMLLEKVKVDRIEVASARVSEGEQQAVKKIMDWASANGFGDRVECLGFTDGNRSVDWMESAGCRVINLLTKGSLKHLEIQLRQTPEEHVKRIRETVDYARSKGFAINVYPEDWSNGMLNSREYALFLIDALVEIGVERIMVPDTLGVLCPDQVTEFIEELTRRHPDAHFDFHGHNDYGLATANSLAAVKAGARGIHCTVNGLGERAGNPALDELVVAIRDFANARTNVQDLQLKGISRIVEVFSGQRIAANKPITGDKVFTQTAGIHADGDKKGDLYSSRLKPSRFARTRTYALGKLSGRANLEFNLRRLGIDLGEEQFKQVLKRVIELGDMKKNPTTEDLPFIISDVFQETKNRVFEISNCTIVSAKGSKPIATARILYHGEAYEISGAGDGGYDAFMKALHSIGNLFEVPMPKLEDYEVHIPPGGHTDALVETTITWTGGLKTRGVNTDQIMAAIEATEHMMNIVQQSSLKRKGAKTGKPAGQRK